MSKNEKILLVLFLVIVIFFLFLFINSKVKVLPEAGNSLKQEESEVKEPKSNVSVAEYIKQIKELFWEYEEILSNDEVTPVSLEQVENIKSRVMALNVPLTYKALHLDLVLSIDSLATYVSSQDQSAKADAIQAVQRLKTQYNWLNK